MTEYKLFAKNLICVCIDSFDNYDYNGRIWNQYDEKPSLFYGCVDMVSQMDELYDKWKFPQKANKYRTFNKKKEVVNTYQNILRGGSKMSIHNIQDKRGDKGTFVVQVQYRQNSTWQGQVIWAEKNKKEYFRSALELMKLIDSAMSEENVDKEADSSVS